MPIIGLKNRKQQEGEGGIMKTIKKIAVIILWALLIIGLTIAICCLAGCATTTCKTQTLEILKTHPTAVVVWGIIQSDNFAEAGQRHVQARIGEKWLTIDQWGRVHESDSPQYRMHPAVVMTGERYAESRQKPTRTRNADSAKFGHYDLWVRSLG